MEPEFISQALRYHGQPLQKIWEDERGDGDLQRTGLAMQQQYNIYQERQKYFTFQDRAKRLKLHQFLARKATDLYAKDLKSSNTETINNDDDKIKTIKNNIAILPPYEAYLNINQDKTKRSRATLEAITAGDLIYGMVTKTCYTFGAMKVKPLCTAEPLVRYLENIPLQKAYVGSNCLGTLPLDSRGKTRHYTTNDYVCCEVLEISIDADRLYLGMKGVVAKNQNIKLGLVNFEELPQYYLRTLKNAGEMNYEDNLIKTKEFCNPNYEILFAMNGLDINDNFTLMSSLKHKFPREEYAEELRQTQASKWAFTSVAEGITRFKNGEHIEAFQCLNKALNIDPRNVEGLVARGALYANRGSFLKAVEDFEKALKLNQYHHNARKYMAETLVALGRNYEDENRINDAMKAYTDCLNVVPNHMQAQMALDALRQQQRVGGFGIFGIQSNQENPTDVTNINANDFDIPNADFTTTVVNDASNIRAQLSPLSQRMAMQEPFKNIDQSTAYQQPFYLSSHVDENTTIKSDEDETASQVHQLLEDVMRHREKIRNKKREIIEESYQLEATTSNANSFTFEREDSLPPPPPRMTIDDEKIEKPKKSAEKKSTTSSKTTYAHRPSVPKKKIENKLSFQIRKPTQMDKLGFRMATPFARDSESKSKSPERTKSKQSYPTRERSRTPDRHSRRRRSSRKRSHSMSRSRSRSHSRLKRSRSRRSHRRSFTRSSSRSRSKSRRRTSRYAHSRRRTPSPFMPRGTPSPESRRHSRRSVSHSPPTTSAAAAAKRDSKDSKDGKFGNLVWRREGYKPADPKKLDKELEMHKPWKHDLFDDGPSIEEIDEIISKAQKERKEEIIKNNKDICKKK